MADPEIGIAPDGDVVFALKDDQGKSCSVRVSSLMLSCASLVFKSMLGPNFSEGKEARSSSNPKRIDLPDDPATATIRLCRILHFGQTSNGEEPLQGATTEEILKVAILMDKYDCVRPALPSLRLALVELSVRPEPCKDRKVHSPADLAAAAYLLRSDELCRLFTRRMVLDMHEPFVSLLQTLAGQILPASLLLAAEDQRATLRRDVVLRVNTIRERDGTDSIGRDREECGGDQETWYDILAAELDLERWPPSFVCDVADIARRAAQHGLLRNRRSQRVQPEISLRVLLYRLKYFHEAEMEASLCDESARQLLDYWFRDVACAMDVNAVGLCCDCAREDFRSKCDHTVDAGKEHAEALELAKKDPLKSKPGNTGSWTA